MSCLTPDQAHGFLELVAEFPCDPQGGAGGGFGRALGTGQPLGVRQITQADAQVTLFVGMLPETTRAAQQLLAGR